jgi:hypothetical protein
MLNYKYRQIKDARERKKLLLQMKEMTGIALSAIVLHTH